jgi:hypothetical protein
MEELIKRYEEQLELRRQENALLEQIVTNQEQTIAHQRQELAERRYRDHLVDESPWGFALWLLLKEVWPFSRWYHRFD